MATPPKVAMPQAESQESEQKRHRSPAYPFINLDTALKRVKQFNDAEGTTAAYIPAAVKHWGYESKSSGGLQTIAALISFGLMTDEGTGAKRKVKITDTARRIVLDTRKDSTERDALIKKAALMPKIHQALWAKWGADRISNENLRHHLLFEWDPRFSEAAADAFIREYRDTITFAKLTNSDTVAPEVRDSGGKYVPKLGDYVQWESNGVLQFAVPRRVTEILDDDFVRVEDSLAGIPVGELIPESSPAPKPEARTEGQSRLPLKTLMQEMVVPLSSGSRAVFQWPIELKPEDVEDLKDSIKMLQRKIDRSAPTASTEKADESQS